MQKSSILIAGAAWAALLCGLAPARAQTVMQQCGQQYQAAKAAGTLNGLAWNQFRTECAARLKATPASTTTAAPAAPMAPAPAPAPIAPAPVAPPPARSTTAAIAPAPMPAPARPTVAGTTAAPMSGGRAAMLTRERQCGAEWRAQKVSLVAQTPGLTWPKYWHECNTRLKAGQ